MEYVLLIYSDEKNLPEMSGEVVKAYQAFNEDVKTAKVFTTARRLQSVTTATTQRVRDGTTLTTDGPFAETKEQLAGFYLLDCADLDEALAWAARMPAARIGSIEVRPVA